MTYLNKNIDSRSGKIYLLPFVVVLMVYGTSVLHTDTHQESSVVNQIMYSSAYIFAFFILLSTERQFFFYVLSKSIPLLITSILGLISLSWSDFPRYVLMSFVHKTGTILVSICATSLLIQDKNKFFGVLLLVFIAYFLANIIFTQLRPDLGLMPATLYGKYRAGMRGLTLHPNTLGGICVIGAWVAFCCLYLINNNKKTISFKAILLLTLLLYCLIRADSMTSLLVTLIMGAIVIWFRYIKSSSSGTLILKIIIAFFGILVSLAILYLFKPEVFSIEYFFKGIGRDSSFTGRTYIWYMALRGISAKPFFGWSDDSLYTYIRYYEIEFTQFHNGYLDFLVRTGYVSFFLFILMLFQIFKSILKQAKNNNYNYIIILAFIIPWLIHNITEASISRNTHLLWYVFLISYFYSVGYKYEFKNSK